MSIRTVRASDIKLTPHGDPTRWGPWQLAPTHNTLEHNERVYEVALLECRTAAQCLDWIAQVAGKTWADPEAAAAAGQDRRAARADPAGGPTRP